MLKYQRSGQTKKLLMLLDGRSRFAIIHMHMGLISHAIILHPTMNHNQNHVVDFELQRDALAPVLFLRHFRTPVSHQQQRRSSALPFASPFLPTYACGDLADIKEFREHLHGGQKTPCPTNTHRRAMIHDG